MDAKTTRTIDACEAFVAGKDDALQLPREAAEFAHTLARATGARRALEIGTSYGYSGLWIGSAVKANGGRLVTIEVSARKSEIAARYFADAGLGETVECLQGRAEQVISTLEGPFDFVLNDADKENCLTYLRMLLPKLERGAVVLTDNTLTHADELAGFVEWARRCPDLRSVHLPMGNGFEMSVRC